MFRPHMRGCFTVNLSGTANNHEVYTRISRLTSSAWNIMRKGRQRCCHNGDHYRRPLSLPLRCDRKTLCLYDDLGQIKLSEIFKTVKTLQNWTNIHRAWDKFVTTCLLPRIREFIYAKHRNTTLGLRPRVVLRCCVWINYRICISKQGLTNSITQW